MPHPSVADSIPDLREVTVARGTRVLCTSDIHLYPTASDASTRMVADLARRLDTWAGPGVLVLAGDCFEGLAVDLDVDRELDAHPELEAAVLAFSKRPDCEVHLLPGNHDGQIAWDERAQHAITTRLGATISMRVDLVCATGEGTKRVRVQHGNSYDHSNAFIDPRDPVDTPLGHHVVREVLPSFRDKPGSMLEGLEWLGDPQQILQFLGSRLAYRQVIRRSWWLLLPFLVAFLIKALASFGLLGDEAGWAQNGRDWVTSFGIIVLVDLALIGVLLIVVSKRVQEAVVAARPGGHDTVKNETPRRAAQQLVLEHGYTGLVSGHTHYPQLVAIPGGFYANDGCGVETVEARDARFGLPSTFGAVLRQSWVVLTAGEQLTVELYVADVPVPSSDPLERIATKPSHAPEQPTMVASWPEGPFYPVREPKLAFAKRRIDVRKTASIGAVVIGILLLVGATLPPLSSRLAVLLERVPLVATQVSAGIMIDVGLWLILASRGLRRGQREAWWASVGLLTLAVGLNVLHGFAFESLIVPLVALAWLVSKRSYFRGRWDRHALRRAIAIFVVGNLVIVAAIIGFAAAWGDPFDAPHDATPEEIAEEVGRDSTTDFDLDPVELRWVWAIIGVAVAVGAGWVLFGSQRHRALTPEERARALTHARAVWAEHGDGSLSYFTLRSDREWFFAETGMVAYSVHHGTCVLSTDPVGPSDQRAELWADFADFADQRGWSIAVLAASEPWLAVYEAAGMETFHLGDEAVLPAARFDLDALDAEVAAHHRAHVEGGWTLTVRTVAEVRQSPTLVEQLVAIAGPDGPGTAAFALDLDRFLDPADDPVLVAVAADPAGRPVGVAQWVPAPALDGFTLSHLFTAEADEADEAIVDFCVVATVLALRARGARAVSGNVVGAHLGSDDLGDATTRAERRRLRRLAEVMEVEGRTTFERYAPEWRPRWVVVEPQRRSVRGVVRGAGAHDHGGSGLDRIVTAS